MMVFDSDDALLYFQAIKQKLQIHRHKPLTSIGERSSPQEEDKAKMLFGNRQAVSSRLSLAKFSK